jgi:ATP-dependent Zn protease
MYTRYAFRFITILHVLIRFCTCLFHSVECIAVSRGGGDGGERVRDSVVNQLLSRMDGVQQMTTPTLLVALTNRIDLIDPALLRPGRFEVHVEVCKLLICDVQDTITCLMLHSQTIPQTILMTC